MKTAALALTALALAVSVPAPAGAETITRERFGCQAQEVTARLFQLVAADEAEAFGALLRSSLATGACRMWKPGEEVEPGRRAAAYLCLTPAGSTGPCYWTSASAIEQPE